MMIQVMLLTVGAILVIGTIFAASVELMRRCWLAVPDSASLFGLLGSGIAAMVVLVAFWVDPIIGLAATLAIVLASLAICVQRRVWRRWRASVPILALFVGLTFAYLGFLYLWASGAGPFTLAATRFYLNPLPVDNAIPSLLAQHLWTGGTEAKLFGDWLVSDRPPLQSGYILIVRSVCSLAHLTPWVGSTTAGVTRLGIDFPASLVSQMLWVPAVYALLRSLRFSLRATVLGIVFTGAVPVTFVNSLYTWPKVLAGAMIVASLASLLFGATDRSRVGRWVVAAVGLATLGILSHGGAALVLPALVGFGVFAVWRIGWRRLIAIVAVSAGSAVILYGPWLAFQQWVDPPGDRLLKWHLAGVVTVDSRSFLQTLIDQYRSTPLSTLLSNRLANLANAFNVNAFDGLSFGNPNWVAVRRNAEFFETPVALVLGFPLTVLMLGAGVLARARRKLRTRSDREQGWLVISMIGCILFWALIMFKAGSAVVHQGAQAWMLVLLAVPLAWLAQRSDQAAFVVVIVQSVASIGLYATSLGSDATGSIQWSAVVILTVGLILIAVAVHLVRANRTPSALVTESPSPAAEYDIAPRARR
jgi:hypothetical protein